MDFISDWLNLGMLIIAIGMLIITFGATAVAVYSAYSNKKLVDIAMTSADAAKASAKAAEESNSIAEDHLRTHKAEVAYKHRKFIVVACSARVYNSSIKPPNVQTPRSGTRIKPAIISSGFTLCARLQNNGVPIDIKGIGLHIECNGEKLEVIPMQHKQPMHLDVDGVNDAVFILHKEAVDSLRGSEPLRVWFYFNAILSEDDSECPPFELDERDIKKIASWASAWHATLRGAAPLYSLPDKTIHTPLNDYWRYYMQREFRH